MFKFIRRVYRVIKIRRRVRRLKKAWSIIHFTDVLMAGKSSQKRAQFWHDFQYHHDFRKFAAKKLMEDL